MRSSLPETTGKNFVFVRSLNFMLSTVLLMAALFAANSTSAQQASKYIFQTSGSASLVVDRNGAAVNMGTGTTTLVGASQDDGRSGIINIGFTFPFMGSNATQFSASSNGAIRLGGSLIATSAYGNSFPVASQQIIAPFWGDLATASNGKVHYKVQGTSPNRVLIVEFLNMEINYNSSSANGTYQARLYENGIIEFVYGGMSVGNVATNTTNNRNYAVGFSENTGADNQFSVDIDAPYATSTTGTRIINTINTTGAIAGLTSTSDGSRRSFTFIPNGYRSQMISLSYGSNTWCAGEARNVTVTIKNIGNLAWDDVGKDINIGLKWNVDSDYGGEPSFITRQDAAGLAPGATATYTFPGVVPPTGTGTENLTADVVYEAVSWFGNNNSFVGPGNTVITSPAITKAALPSATTVSGGGTFCNSRVITASGGTGGTIYFQGTTSGGTSTATASTSQTVTTSGTYYFRSRNNTTGCWGAEGSTTVTINTTPVISVQPQSQTICEGAALNLSVTASGTPAPTYQWKRNGVNISGATSSTYSVPSALAANGGAYTVDVTNSCATVTSATANVVVNVAPAVTVNPVSQTICAGNPVTFTVTATGTNLTYQWRKGGVNIGGANASSYNIPSVTPASAGNYDVVVSNTGCASATSAAATLTVNESPVITLNPVSQTVCEGATIVLTGSASGVPAVTYQWQKNGSDIAGETSSSLSLNGVTTADNGSYRVIATNVCNSATSSAAVIVVNESAAITVDPASQTICAGLPVTFTVTATGTNLNYQWRKGGVNIGGANASSYTIPSVTPASAGNYDVVVSNTGCASATSAAATLTVNESPVITLDPVSQTVCEGATIVLTGSASGVPAVTYQWQKNGSDISGETSSSLTLTGVTVADNGSYSLVATNICNTATSAAAVVVVNEAPAVTVDPASQTICAGQPVTFSVTATGTNLTYQWRKDGGNIGGATSSSYSIPSVVPGDAGNYDVVVSSTGCASATSAAAVLAVNESPVITLNPVSQTICEGSNIVLTASASGVPSVTYQWQKNGSDIIGETSSSLTLNGVSTADNGSYTIVATNICNTATSSAAVIVVNEAPVVTVDPVSQTICAGQPVTFTVTATGTNLNYQWRKGGVNISGANGSSYTIASVVTGSAGNYDVVVSNTGCTDATSAVAVLTVNEAPVITLNPVSQTVCEGSNVTFTASASGVPAASYQWQKNGSDIAGENSSSLTLNNVTTADNGNYRIVATNVCGEATSTAATLLVNVAPVVTVDPVSQTICAGQPVTFTVTATGTNLNYQWRKNGSNIGGATSASYTIASAVSGDAGNYDVVISNSGCSSTTSAVAVLVVNNRPTAVITSGNATICSTYPTTISGNVTASGAWTLTLSDNQTTTGTGNGAFSFTINPASNTTYTLTALVDANCTSIAGDLTGSAVITTNPLPASVSITPSSATICNGGTQALIANGTTPQTQTVLVNNNFSAGVTTSGSVSGNRSQIFQRETSGQNVNSTGTYTSPNGSGILMAISAASGSGFPTATANSSANTSAIVQVSTVGFNSVNLTYNHTYAQANGGGSGTVAVSTDGVSFTTIKTFTTNQGSQGSFVSDNIALSNAYLNQPALRIRFTYVATGSSSGFLSTSHAYWWAIDDVSINGQLAPLFSWTADTGSGVNGLPAGVGTPSATNKNITVEPSATTIYTLTATNPVTGCASSSNSTITVNDRPTADLSGGAVYCNGQTTTTTLSLAVTGAGTISGTLSDGTPFSGTAPTITVDVTPVATTTYTIATLSDANCTSIATDRTGSATVTVNARPTAVLSGGASYCNGDVTTTTLTLTVTGSGTISGTLSDGTPFSGTAPTITVDVTPVLTTTYTIATLSDENCTANGGDMSGSATVTINPLLPVSVTIASSDLDNTICDGTSVTFTATPVNEGPNPSYQWLLNGNPVGTNQTTYTTSALVNGDVVSVVLTSDITPCAITNPATSNAIATVVDALQPVSVSIVSSENDNEICDGTSVTFTATPVNGGLNPSYQWLLNGSPVGTDQDTYTTTALANGDVVSVVLTSNITPCATGNPATSNSIATIVNANQPVSVVIYSDAAAVCAGSVINFSLVPTNEGPNPSYQWYVNGIAITDSTNTTFAPEFLEDGDVVTVVLTSDITPCATQNPATSNSITVGISPIPTAPGPITGITDACPYTDTNIPVTFTIDPVPGVADYTWVYPANGVTYVSGQGTTSLTVTFQSNFALTNQYFRVRTNSSFPCSSAFSDHEVLKIIPAIAGPISGPVNVCQYVGQPTTVTYSIDPVANATGYTWTAPPNASIVSGQGTTQVEVSFSSAFLGGSIRVSADANCGSRAARSLALGKQGAQAPGPITGPTNACPYLGNLTTATYTIDAVANATNYEWVVPANCNIVSGQGTTSLTVTFNANYSSGQIRVRAQSACNNSGYRAISVANATYSAPGLISGPASACSYIGTATVATYTINKVANAPAYLWTVPAGVTISAHPGGAGVNDTIIEVLFNNSFVNGSSISVQATGCITTAASSIQVFRSASSGMPGILTGPTNVCEYMISTGNPAGTIAEYTVRKAQGATSYNWTAPAGATIVSHPNGAGANDTVVQVIYSAGFTSGAITVTSSNGCGNSSARSLNVVKLQPMSPGGVAVAEIQSCPSRMLTYTMAALPANATGISWTIPAGGTIVSGQGTTSITVSYTSAAVTGAVTATPFNNCASSSTRSVAVKLAPCAEPRLITKTTIAEALSVSVYPNPSQHEFRVKIKTPESGKVQIRVLDMMGREMSRKVIGSNETIALGSELKTGTYFIEVLQNGRKAVSKVIKQ